MTRTRRTLVATGAAVALTVPTAALAASSPAASTPAAAPAVNNVRASVVIGRTAKGRAINAFQLGDRTKPAQVVLATLHGNERMNHYVVNSLKWGAQIKGVNLWVIEYANPDGWAAASRYNGRGVDINRNFPVKWSRSTTRAGSGPASEPETKALIAFMNKINPKAVVSLHQPLYGVDYYGIKNKALATSLAKNLGLPIKDFACSGTCTGTFTQWFNATHTGSAITVEFSKAPTRTQMSRAADGILRSLGGSR